MESDWVSVTVTGLRGVRATGDTTATPSTDGGRSTSGPTPSRASSSGGPYVAGDTSRPTSQVRGNDTHRRVGGPDSALIDTPGSGRPEDTVSVTGTVTDVVPPRSPTHGTPRVPDVRVG